LTKALFVIKITCHEISISQGEMDLSSEIWIFDMEPHGLSPWYLQENTLLPPLGAEALRCAGAKASEGYPPPAKSAEATSFNASRVEAQVTHSSTGRAHGFLRWRIKFNRFKLD